MALVTPLPWKQFGVMTMTQKLICLWLRCCKCGEWKVYQTHLSLWSRQERPDNSKLLSTISWNNLPCLTSLSSKSCCSELCKAALANLFSPASFGGLFSSGLVRLCGPLSWCPWSPWTWLVLSTVLFTSTEQLILCLPASSSWCFVCCFAGKVSQAERFLCVWEGIIYPSSFNP